MPRQARKRSSTGIYHVMLRGIDRRDIFLDDEDRIKFIKSILKAKRKGEFKIYGYCLMDNHVHILIKEDEKIGISIKRIIVGYVGWYNRKYERIGHLFQNRYMSEPVETDNYLLIVLRYIHQNPVKAGMVNRTEDYKWSSYNKYYLSYQGQKSFTSSDLIETCFKTFEDFSNYMNAHNNDKCLECDLVKRHNDNTLRTIINKQYNVDNIVEILYRKEIKSLRKYKIKKIQVYGN